MLLIAYSRERERDHLNLNYWSFSMSVLPLAITTTTNICMFQMFHMFETDTNSKCKTCHISQQKKNQPKTHIWFWCNLECFQKLENDLSFRQLTNFNEKRKTGNGSMFDCTSTTLHRDPLFGIFVSNIIFF